MKFKINYDMKDAGKWVTGGWETVEADNEQAARDVFEAVFRERYQGEFRITRVRPQVESSDYVWLYEADDGGTRVVELFAKRKDAVDLARRAEGLYALETVPGLVWSARSGERSVYISKKRITR